MANALMTALAKAQLEFAPIVKNRTNYNKGTYADLTAILEAVKPALLAHGIVILQSPVTRYLENNLFVVDIVTTICHGESGETFEGILSMPAKNDAQAIGSAITYGRRYALVSMLSLSTEDDDDGEEAVKPAQKATQPQRQAQQPPAHRQPAPTATPTTNGHKPPTVEAPAVVANHRKPTTPSADVDEAWPPFHPEGDEPFTKVDGHVFKGKPDAILWGASRGVFANKHECAASFEKNATGGKTWPENCALWIAHVRKKLMEQPQEQPTEDGALWQPEPA